MTLGGHARTDDPVRSAGATGEFLEADDGAVVLGNAWSKQRRTFRLDGTLRQIATAAVSSGGQSFALHGINKENKSAIAVYHVRGDALLPPRIILPTRGGEIRWMFLSGDGARLAVRYVSQPASVHVWSVTDGRDISPECATPADGNDARRCLMSDAHLAAMTEAGSSIVISTEGRTELFDLTRGVRSAIPLLEGTVAAALAFSPDGRLLGLADESGVLHVVDLREPNREAARISHDAEISEVAFSPDGARIATVSGSMLPTGGVSYTLRIFTVAPGDLLAAADSRLDALRRAGRFRQRP